MNPAENSVTQIISASRLNPGLLAELEKFRRKITVMFTDIKGSTSYFEKHGDIAGLMMVHECNALLRKSIEEFEGRFIKTIGDAVMATFDDAPSAIRASIKMQKSLTDFNSGKPDQDWVTIRIGLNHGLGIVKSDDVFGDVVNVASRVESVAQPEQIVVSDSVHELLAGSTEFQLEYLGRFALKGKEENRDLYEVVWQQKTLQPNYAAVHTVVIEAKASRVPRIKIQQIRQDGSIGLEKAMAGTAMTVGSSQGDLVFSGDPRLAPLHARFHMEGGQLMVEDLAGLGVFVRLIGTYTLLNGDEVMMGEQVLRFHEKPQAMAAAAATGTNILDMANILNEPVAEFVRVNTTAGEQERFPLIEETVTWGRSKGTYTFPEDRLVSRTHCRVYQRGENFFLEDMGSRNGTFVKVRGKVPVPIGASVRIGGQILRVAE
jgi:class 3 adenylate cyclase